MAKGQGSGGTSRRGTGGVGPSGHPTRSSFRIRVAANGGVVRQGPADAFELPSHFDLTGPGAPVPGPPVLPGRPDQWRGPGGAPADVTRLPLRTGSAAREGEAQSSRPNVDSLALQTDGLLPACPRSEMS